MGGGANVQVDERHDLDARFDAVRDELIAAFRRELATAVALPARTIVVAITTGALILSALVIMLEQVLV